MYRQYIFLNLDNTLSLHVGLRLANPSICQIPSTLRYKAVFMWRSLVVQNLQLPSHRVELCHHLGVMFGPVGVWGDRVQVDLGDHSVEKVANLIIY